MPQSSSPREAISANTSVEHDAEPYWAGSYPPGVTWRLPLKPRSVTGLLAGAVAKYGPQPLVSFGDATFTYDDIDRLSDRAAAGLRRLGVGPGRQVGLYLPNTPVYPIMFFGALKLGARVVNMSPLDAPRELRHKIEDGEVSVLVTLALPPFADTALKLLAETDVTDLVMARRADALPGDGPLPWPGGDDPHIHDLQDLLACSDPITPVDVADPVNEVAVLQYTGGTTGVPKAAMLTHSNLVISTEMQNAWTMTGDEPILKVGDETMLLVLPLFHIYALSPCFLRSVDCGWHVVLHPRFDAATVLKDLVDRKVTIFPGVPTMYTALMGLPQFKTADLSCLRSCASGGAPLPVEVREAFERATGIPVLEGWGMTETSPAGTGSPMIEGYRAPRGSCGLPLPGLILEIVDLNDPLKLLPPGETGELCIRGPNVMKGYWKRPEATEDAFAGGRFHTGDVGYMDEKGYLFLVDRKKDMILSGGFNVYPRVIEEAIYEHPSVAEVIVIGVPDSYRGQAAKAFIKLKDGADELSLDALRDFLTDKIGRHELPAAVEYRDDLPKTPVGKLSKKELVAEERAKWAATQAAAEQRARA
ncbi:dicarboxylate--CoA ligase PimA [Tistrella bauzanensis]|uniref:Long-chain-fatty-acid--CoA ligase n=1 Tax=Tistrella bauzanensis TaxID=657419 RepID=A0ABQ1J6M7_9PROT|nr:AMP-binding protein [Tistrella bauzanensis]GGB61282.1 dicarboxylate--CoA ligase PimA [Tistrella bauzanensis]